MQLPALATWAWIPIVIAAAAAQTARNAAQRSLTGELGTMSATLVRFLYGLPFATLWLVLVLVLLPANSRLPAFGLAYFAWLSAGAVAQILATAFLLVAMKERNFVTGVALAKTEVLQAALFAAVLLLEFPGGWSAFAMLGSTVGVVLLSLPKTGRSGGLSTVIGGGKAAVAGLASGACFAMASVGYRGAALTLPDVSPWLVGASGVLLAQILQSLLLIGWIGWHERGKLRLLGRAWRRSTAAGAMGALASVGWFTAFAMRPVADIKTLGLIEVFFSFLVSRKLFGEHLSRLERGGLLLVLMGLVVICAQL